MNLLSPLIDNIFQLPKAINSIIHKLPDEAPFVPNDKLKMGNSLYIPIGLTSAKKELNLVLDDSNPHCLICGCTRKW